MVGWLGFLFALGCVALAQQWHGGSLLTLIDGPAFVIVMGGTLGAVVLQTPVKGLARAARQLRLLFINEAYDLEAQAVRFEVWLQRSRQYGFLSLETLSEHESDPFTRKGLAMLVDGVEQEQMKAMLEEEIFLEQERNEHTARVFESMGGYSPTVGIIGAVLGLIQAMKSLEHPDQLGAGIAVAFVATIYGVGFANLLYLPIANRLRALHYHHLLFQEMTLEGLMSIARGDNLGQLRLHMQMYLKGE